MLYLTEKEIPPKGGWEFFQPETNWWNPCAKGGFKISVDAIRAHRKRYPSQTAGYPTDYDSVAEELLQYNSKRLCRPLKPKQQTPAEIRVFREEIAEIAKPTNVEQIIACAENSGMVLSWLRRNGAAVDEEIASNRGFHCCNCGRNIEAEWFVKSATELLVDAGRKRNPNLPHKPELKTCEATQCDLNFLIWVKSDETDGKIAARTIYHPPDQCWVKPQGK